MLSQEVVRWALRTLGVYRVGERVEEGVGVEPLFAPMAVSKEVKFAVVKLFKEEGDAADGSGGKLSTST